MAYIEALEQALGKTAQKNFLPLQDGDVPATHADTTELNRVTGFAPQTQVADGVKRFVDWYRSYMHV
jgi:UDP-glucuronate 4-epimerase